MATLGTEQSVSPYPAAPHGEPEALPPTPKRQDEDDRHPPPTSYTPVLSTPPLQTDAAAEGSANGSQPQFSFIYPQNLQNLQRSFPQNLPGSLFVPQPTATSAVGAFPLLVAAAVAAQPAPIQPGPAPDQETGGSGSVKRKRRPTKVYACTFPGCSRVFTRHFNLQTHMKTHDPNREKPFTCDICDKAFGRKVDRDRHLNGK